MPPNPDECDEHCINFCRLLRGITDVHEIARGPGIRIHDWLVERYGPGRWRKLKGNARIETIDSVQRLAEVHWFEAHGIGKRQIKRKRFLD